MQKRPNYKNVGEEDEEERQSEDTQDDLDKTKSMEASSKGIRTSSENEGVYISKEKRCLQFGYLYFLRTSNFDLLYGLVSCCSMLVWKFTNLFHSLWLCFFPHIKSFYQEVYF